MMSVFSQLITGILLKISILIQLYLRQRNGEQTVLAGIKAGMALLWVPSAYFDIII